MIESKINIITWNDQGAGSKEFIIQDPIVLVLVETRLSSPQADKVCETIGFDGMTRVGAVGFWGGIWILWHK
ncbi:hypothetical protein V2J09_018284 [Rumex salicifolius]